MECSRETWEASLSAQDSSGNFAECSWMLVSELVAVVSAEVGVSVA